MASTAREWLWLVRESAYKVPIAVPVVGTDQFLIPLPESNAFPLAEDITFGDIAFGGGFDVVRETVPGMRTIKGTITVPGYPLLAAELCAAACNRINTAQTLPFVTTEPATDIVSYSLYHQIRTRAGTILTYAYPGAKIISLEGSVTRQRAQGLQLKVEFQAWKELPNAFDSSAALTAPTAPTDAQYPTGPYTIKHTLANVLRAGTAIDSYEELTFKITNKMDPCFFEDDWLSILPCLGREATVDMSLLLKPSPDLREIFKAVTSHAFLLKFDNGVNTLTINFGPNNHLNKLPFDLGLGKVFRQKATWMNKWDSSGSADVIASST